MIKDPRYLRGATACTGGTWLLPSHRSPSPPVIVNTEWPIGQSSWLLIILLVVAADLQLMIYLRLTHTRLRLSFSRIFCTNPRFNMSMKTIAVLDNAELKDGEMYVHPVLFFVSNLINRNRTGRKSVSKMERFFYLAWVIRCMQLVHIVPTTERLLPKVS